MTRREKEARERRVTAVVAALSEAFGLTEVEREKRERFEVRVLKEKEAKGE